MNEINKPSETQDVIIAIFQKRWVRVAACVAMMLIFVWNGDRYRTRHGFDAGSHTSYAEIIAEQNHIASPNEEDAPYVSYNPPVFYLFAAIMDKVSVTLGGNKDEKKFAARMEAARGTEKEDDVDAERRERKFGAARRFTKISLSVLVGILAILSMSLCGRILGPRAKTPYLLLLLSIPAFFKYPAMFTPESMLTVTVWASMLVGLWDFGEKKDVLQAIAAGLLGALAIWTRPLGFAVLGAWGITLVVSLVFWRSGGRRWLIKSAIICVICAVAGAGLFAWNGQRTGKTMPRPKKSEAVLGKLPLSFYIGIRPLNLIARPYREDSPDRLLQSTEDVKGEQPQSKTKQTSLNSWYTILYADAFGDYWKYWSLNHRLNDEEISKSFWRFTLGLQNILALFPTFLMIGGLFVLGSRAVRSGPSDALAWFVPIGGLLVAGGLLYFYVMISMPANQYNQVKALYIHFLLPAIPFGGAYLASKWTMERRESTAIVLPYIGGFCLWSMLLFGIYWH